MNYAQLIHNETIPELMSTPNIRLKMNQIEDCATEDYSIYAISGFMKCPFKSDE